MTRLVRPEHSGHILGYGAADLGALHLTLGGGYTWSDVDSRRSVAFGGLTEALTANYNGSVIQGFGEARLPIRLGGGVIAPFAGVSVSRIRTGTFSENGGIAALTGAAATETFTASTLGFKLETPQAGPFHLRAKFGWQHGFGELNADKALRLGSDALFAVEGASLSRNAGMFEGEAVWRLPPTATISAGYSGRIGNAGETHAAKATLTVGF